MDKTTIDNLERELTVDLVADSALRATFLKYCGQLRQDNITLEQFSEALDTIEVGYSQNKLSYSYVARRQIEKRISELSKIKTYKTVGSAIGSTVDPVWNKALKPAANKTVVPAAVAVSGFFRGLFSK